VLSAEEAETSRWSHVLWNCIGSGNAHFSPEVYKATLQPGDVVLLCTDGLSKYVADERIGRELVDAPTAEEAARRLVDAANEAGGSDNITAVVARLRGGATADDTAVDATAFLPAM
jgi:protein phosphatase